ncbi:MULTISPECIES: ABC transporter permease [Streptomonospora]|uniref:ABC transporter permease n=2 Tax=Streptomonospora TaxID=104204 RepID=A0ABV9SRZ0_9ACTN
MTAASLEPRPTVPAGVPNPSRNWPALLLHDMRYGITSAVRTPFPLATALFLPLFFNVMFNLLQDGQTVGGIPNVSATTATIVVFVVTTSGYFNMAIGVTVAREKGVLKRVRQTPMPKTLHLMSRIGVSTVMAAGSVLLMVAISMAAFGLEIRPLAVPGLVLGFFVCCFTSAVLGMGLSRFIPTLEGGVVIGTATLFPLLFLSGVFFPLALPEPLQTVVDLLPFAPMATLVRTSFDPGATGLALDLPALAVVAAWGAVGLLATLKLLRWEPRR